MLAPVLIAAALVAQNVYADGRDDRTLLVQKLINRNLDEQLAPYRFGRDLGPFTIAADLLINGQLPVGEGRPAPFHGYFFLDAYLALQVFENVDVNLNVFVLNRTASGGFRVQSRVLPGLAAHWRPTIATIAGEDLYLDLLAVDLDVVTVGQGLLVETIPLEGFLASVHWNGFELRSLFGGRVFWGQDDLFHVGLIGWDGLVGAGYSLWFTGFPQELPARGGYPHVFGRWSPIDRVTLAAEYALRVTAPEGLAHAVLGRADFLEESSRFSFHAGYQFRWYQHGMGPFDQLLTPSTLPSIPIREDYYATNSFEYLWLSPIYDQWSHTVMLEVQYRIRPIEVFAESELWVRFFSDPDQEPARVVGTIDGETLPGILTTVFYSAGVRLYPLEGLPHRMAAYVTNKSVATQFEVTTPQPLRFLSQHLFFLEAELRL